MNKLENGKIPLRFYWFYIETYVYISCKKDSLLLYNTYTGKYLEYSGEPYRDIFRLVRRLQKKKNLRISRMTEKELQEPVISEFIQSVRAHFMGDLLDSSYSEGKPIQAVPIVTVRKSISILKKKYLRSVGEGMMKYLTEISLYINGACHQGCHICGTAYKQFPCCTIRKSGKKELELTKIIGLLKEITSGSLMNLNIMGGNILAYSNFAALVETLNKESVIKSYVTHYKNILNNIHFLEIFDTQSSVLNIIVTFPIDKNKLHYTLETVNASGINAKFTFILQNESDFKTAEKMIETLQLPDFNFKPFFNGNNINFFRNNVFFEKEEILEAKPSLRDIYRNSQVNSLNFGRLVIFNDGHIHANVNAPRLGVLGRDSIYDVLFKEMSHGKSWRRIRCNVAPCKGCEFNCLCPPITNYTYVIGRSDLCFKGNSDE